MRRSWSRAPYDLGMDVREAAALIRHRVRDYQPALPTLHVRFLRRAAYKEALADHPPVAEQISLGLVDEERLRQAVFGTYEETLLTASPELFVEILHDEPRRLHRPYVDGAVLRELLLFLTEEGDWRGRVTVRAVMAKHFPFQLVATEAVDGEGALIA